MQQATLGHRGRKHDPLYRARKLLLARADRLTRAADRGCPRPWRLVTRPARSPPLGRSPSSSAACTPPRDLAAARRALELLWAYADASRVPECRRFVRTVRRCEDEVLAYFTTGGARNGPT